jgi:integrase
MKIRKRGKSGIIWLDGTINGRRIRKSTGQADPAIAKRIRDKILGQVAEGKYFDKLPGEEKTVAELLEKYMTEFSARNKAARTYTRDKSLKAHLVRHLGDCTLSSTSPKLISEYKVRRREEGASPRTVNYELALLSHAFNLAIKEWEWCKDNPTRRVSREKVNNLRERWLNQEEEKKLLGLSPKWLQEMIVFSIYTGLRQDELIKLEWTRVDLFKKTMTILEQKNKGRDTLPLNDAAMEVLKARARARDISNNLVFHSASGTPIIANNLRRAFYSATKKAKITNFHWHDLRHTFATRLIQAGVDIYTVQRLGRWRNISMVMRYAHHYPESLRAGIKVLDKPRNESVTNPSQEALKNEISQESR